MHLQCICNAFACQGISKSRERPISICLPFPLLAGRCHPGSIKSEPIKKTLNEIKIGHYYFYSSGSRLKIDTYFPYMGWVGCLPLTYNYCQSFISDYQESR